MQATIDPLVFFEREYETVKPALAFTCGNLDEALEWQERARRRLNRLLGDFPRVTGPVRSRVLEKRSFRKYTRTKLELELRPGLLAMGYYLLPNSRPAKCAAVLAVPGHGKCVDDLVGGPDGEGDPSQYALDCCEAGLAVLALEQMAFGHRRDARSLAENPEGGTACQVPAGAALILGRTLLGYRVLDARRALDWLAAQPEVDRSRLGMTGMSGGGTVTFFTAALEPRLKAVLVSGYFNTFKGSIYSIYHCIDNFVPGILRWFEMPDIVGLIAPRWAFFEQGEEDPIFPLRSFREGVAKAASIYKVFGVPDRTGWHTYPGGHQWNGVKGVPWFVKALS